MSEASSSTIQLIFSPPIVVGSSSNVFFSGMPSDAAGPVAEMVTPTLISASAGAATASTTAAASARSDFGDLRDVHCDASGD